MPRRGRSAAPPPAQRRPVPSHVPATTPAAAPPAMAAPSALGAPQQPSLFKQMAATAGGVAVGSAVGHVVGAGITGMMSGGGSSHDTPAATAAAPQQQMNGPQTSEQGPCAWQIRQFLQCAQEQSDITLCEGFNEAIRQCKQQNNLHF